MVLSGCRSTDLHLFPLGNSGFVDSRSDVLFVGHRFGAHLSAVQGRKPVGLGCSRILGATLVVGAASGSVVLECYLKGYSYLEPELQQCCQLTLKRVITAGRFGWWLEANSNSGWLKIAFSCGSCLHHLGCNLSPRRPWPDFAAKIFASTNCHLSSLTFETVETA